MTKVIQTASMDMQSHILDNLTQEGLDDGDQIELNTSLSFAKTLSRVGEFEEVNGETYVSLKSLGLAMYTLLRNDVGSVSDGSHTFNELYDHRCVLFLCLMAMIAENGAQEYGVERVWWSEKHSDDTMFEGYIIVGMETRYGHCTYHMKDNPYGNVLRQILSSSAPLIQKLDHAPEWDGHNSDDVLKRLSATFLGDSLMLQSKTS